MDALKIQAEDVGGTSLVFSLLMTVGAPSMGWAAATGAHWCSYRYTRPGLDWDLPPDA
jgi:hypothetical protein